MTGQMLGEIAEAVGGRLLGDPETRCGSVASSTTTVESGSIFVAVRGHSVDGHTFVAEAARHGAVAAVVEDPSVLDGMPGVVVSNSRVALSRLAAVFAGRPSEHMRVVGITGTNGKTTINWMVYHVLNLVGYGSARIGTLGFECLGQGGRSGELTSPDPISLHRMMAEALSTGASACVIETSSHALDQYRVADVAFDVAVFTNLSRDHLDYHGTLDAYFSAKLGLFDLLSRHGKGVRAAVVNVDDEYGRRVRDTARSLGLSDWSFGKGYDPTVLVRHSREEELGTTVSLVDTRLDDEYELTIPFFGNHNVENAAAAFAVCSALGVPSRSLCEALSRVPQVPGRLERIGSEDVRVVVDFAHTPDALERVLTAVRPTTSGHVWVVFGCGGDRDRGKRPEMGRVASRLADRVVVTSDNPRTEDPGSIIDEIVEGVAQPYLVEADRQRAIEAAIRAATSGDTVVVAGKGHESYQIIGREKRYFSDQEVCARALEGRKR